MIRILYQKIMIFRILLIIVIICLIVSLSMNKIWNDFFFHSFLIKFTYLLCPKPTLFDSICWQHLIVWFCCISDIFWIAKLRWNSLPLSTRNLSKRPWLNMVLVIDDAYCIKKQIGCKLKIYVLDKIYLAVALLRFCHFQIFI